MSITGSMALIAKLEELEKRVARLEEIRDAAVAGAGAGRDLAPRAGRAADARGR